MELRHRKNLEGNEVAKVREVEQISAGSPTSDGAGVKLTRIIGTPELDMVDPLLLLDMFGTDRREDYIAGFPPHPHRGFETVTYLVAGRMRHKDNAGHEGVIEPGGVQWMSAARGIVHSEMPEQEDGLLQGFQLWINLPAVEKMNPPTYQEFSAEEIPLEAQENGTRVKVIAGCTDHGTQGLVKNKTTAPIYLDVELGAQAEFSQSVPASHNGVVYVVEGKVLVGEQKTSLDKGALAVLGSGDKLDVMGNGANARVLVIAAKRLDEPVARGGPFVMNTRAEVLQAFQDYQNGKI